MTEPVNFNKPTGDGAKWSASDFLHEFEKELSRVLATGQDFDTGYYAVRKEPQTGRVYRRGETITVEVNVIDDFDSEGRAEVTFPVSDFWGKEADDAMLCVRAALDEATDKATEDKADNDVVGLYTVGRDKGPDATGWTFTFLLDVSGDGLDAPPGDYYHRWGWQEVDTDDDTDRDAYPKELGAEVAAKISAAIYEGVVLRAGKGGVVVDGWRVSFASE